MIIFIDLVVGFHMVAWPVLHCAGEKVEEEEVGEQKTATAYHNSNKNVHYTRKIFFFPKYEDYGILA